MRRGGFGRGGFRMRRVGVPLMGMGMGGFGSPLLTTLMAGGMGYMLGSNSGQQAVPQAPMYAYPQYPPPMVAQGTAASTDNGTLAQLKLLGDLHNSGTLTDDEF